MLTFPHSFLFRCQPPPLSAPTNTCPRPSPEPHRGNRKTKHLGPRQRPPTRHSELRDAVCYVVMTFL
ncbi:hypothetical protein E2C01_023926 [Portunus trituberculatus]|uniref:Uncharacterized protein n=1 Tax=Portunus trituberculatus TaxID=210409 RepID=A0A5B7EAK7_PORTR|nr:hypothetical protein [Portunus trituberculatus]